MNFIKEKESALKNKEKVLCASCTRNTTEPIKVTVSTIQSSPLYCCHTYASFERGSNENHNRMIRCFLPKGTKQITTQAVSKIEIWMNVIQEKCLSIRHQLRCLFEIFLYYRFMKRKNIVQ
ncbi:MAG TPA: hypothetical protein VGC17_06940 [Lactovum miscens]